MLKSYYTIKENGIHEIDIKKSRFITNMARVTNEAAAKTFIQKIKKEHYQATHNCSAFIIGEQNEIQRAHDDGEPSGTAGVPMLESLKLMALQNVVAVTTRYFGGIKLGAGGLIRAYSNSVSEAAHAIGIVRGTLQRALNFHLAYNQIDLVQNYFDNSTYQIDDIQYTTDIAITAFIDSQDIAQIKADLTDLLNGQIQFEVGTERFREVLVNSNQSH
ncbi:YigZ family protein [Lactobacillus sp. CC-MHH1034]|uniref:YigZ family protein n=1 Tax=Agrilactobacillus fermenti TaxID=2586909 RepID=UPI001E4A0C8F|nr:YigZ family protein [Agrilactobacillus fermenti]MCD2257209.1 YigZ family protein [Agrilactobacillus fermenti]